MAGTLWITGASSGIGRAVALRYAREGWKVVASARGADQLAVLAAEMPGRIVAEPLDVADPAAVAAAVARIDRDHGPLDAAILNAGTHKAFPAEQFDVASFRALVEINLMGAVHCLGAVLPLMIGRRRGQIAVVSSVAGYSGLPTAAAYGATKAALINMCEALRPECARNGVDLRLINPGFVRTPLTDRNEFPMPFLMEVDDAAARVFDGLTKGTAFEITFPRRFAFILKFLRQLPYFAYFPLVRRITGA
jgi:NAD(P)-dependent dehydrogenase (short-subunit alcohol dehydrogenase family)